MKMVNGSFVKGRESLSCCDWFSMKLHEMMFRIKTFFDSDNNFHYGHKTSNIPGEVLDISLGGEVRHGPSYPDPV